MIAPARRVAYRILLQMATSDAHSDELLRASDVNALTAQDRNLVTTLVLGTLRWQLAIDARMRALLARPNAQLSSEAATALRMGAYQLLYLDRVPAHAVIHDSVELVKQSNEPGAAGMVNAVLRRIAAEGKAPVPGSLRTALEVATAFAHPAWMVERWAQRYGIATAEAICRWDQQPASTALRFNLLAGTDPAAVSAMEGVELEPGGFLAGALRLVRGDIAGAEPFLTRELRIQEEASQLVAEIAAAAAPAAERVLDTCAAPGGKTAILAERLPQAEITAVDVSRKRLDAMRRMLAGSSAGKLRFEVGDAATLPVQLDYALILCDVPCSGTGTIGRNPEIRLRVNQADLARQQTRQIAILRASLRRLGRGARLVYATCSLEPEENESVVEAVLREHADLRAVPVEEILDRLAANRIVTPSGRTMLRTATAGPYLRTIPGVHPCDGFFAAVLERR